MKKLLLSNPFKAVTAVICAVCAAVITYAAIDGFIKTNEGSHSYGIMQPAYELLNIMSFSKDYSNSYAAEEAVMEVSPSPMPAADTTVLANVMEIERTAKKYSDKLDYYISIPSQNVLITNQESFDAEKFVNAEYMWICQRIDGQSSDLGNIGYRMKVPGTADYQIYIALKSDYAAECKELEATENIMAVSLIRKLTILCAVLLLGILYQIAAAGKKYGIAGVQMCFIDRLKVELNLALIGIIIAAAVIYTLIVDSFAHDKLALYGASAVGTGFIFCEVLGLSLVRQVKNHSFWKNTILSLLLGKLKRLFHRIIGGKHMKYVIQSAAKDKYGTVYIVGAVAYAALSVLSPFTAVIATAAFVVLIVRRISDLCKIRNGVEEICGGNTEYKIEECVFPDYKLIAERINEMGDGMKDAIDRRVRSERMKAELITNVSHDLKTPLTSIISYAKLLEELNPEPAEARDYVAVIQKKGEQLKKLSTELFEISKAQSGNVEVNMEKLDINLLINQALGELNGDIVKSELDFIVKTEGELFINADGKKLSRVFENLIVNILKYSLKGTRVFIDTSESEGKVTAVFRNISEKPLNFDAEEITERFVRGDSARTGDGNGLGLAIAKSYTELCGGSFKITIDGDLFKAELRF